MEQRPDVRIGTGEASRGCDGFPAWAARECDRLLRARAAAGDPSKRAQVELQLALLCDVADRYGRLKRELSESPGG